MTSKLKNWLLCITAAAVFYGAGDLLSTWFEGFGFFWAGTFYGLLSLEIDKRYPDSGRWFNAKK